MDDKRDVEHEVNRPAIDSWTENDPPAEMLKGEKAKKRRAVKDDDQSKLASSARPGTGRPDEEEMYRGRLQRSK